MATIRYDGNLIAEAFHDTETGEVTIKIRPSFGFIESTRSKGVIDARVALREALFTRPECPLLGDWRYDSVSFEFGPH